MTPTNKMTAIAPTATMYVLLGFHTQLPPQASPERLLVSCCKIARAVEPQHLARGSLETLGMHEMLIEITESVTSEPYDDAIRSSRHWVHENLARPGSGAPKDRGRIDRHVMRNRIILFDAEIMDADEVERLDLHEPGWRSPQTRRTLGWPDF